MDYLTQAITVAYRKRCEKWDQFRHTIGSRARMTFVRNLEHRGFSGKLGFDHLNCNLTIRVQTDSIAGMKKDAKALSGGEKSFSTICLLMTLWEAVGSPLRCLDEFVRLFFFPFVSSLISISRRMSSWSVLILSYSRFAVLTL